MGSRRSQPSNDNASVPRGNSDRRTRKPATRQRRGNLAFIATKGRCPAESLARSEGLRLPTLESRKGRPVELALTLDAKSDKSLQAQIFDQVRLLILDGRLQAGMSLPPTRLLAERYQVSRNTVIIAFDRLAAEGYVEGRGTSGLFVTSIPPDDLLLVSSPRAPLRSNGPVPPEVGEPLLCFAGSPGGGEDRPTIDFWVGRSAASGFPLRVWRRIVTKLLSGESQYLTDYCDPAGLPQLRKAIADHL